MPYRENIFYPGGFFHLYSRGVEKRDIFLVSKDFQKFLSKLEEYLKQQPLTILCYCLMPNHYHLLVRQNDRRSISQIMRRLNTSYSMYFNIKYERVGPLFQSRFKARHIDKEEYLLHLSRYIHLNPYDISSSKEFENYPWSSYRNYLDKKVTPLCDPRIILSYFEKTDIPSNSSYELFIKAGIENKKEIEEWEQLLNSEFTKIKSRP